MLLDAFCVQNICDKCKYALCYLQFKFYLNCHIKSFKEFNHLKKDVRMNLSISKKILVSIVLVFSQVSMGYDAFECKSSENSIFFKIVDTQNLFTTLINGKGKLIIYDFSKSNLSKSFFDLQNYPSMKYQYTGHVSSSVIDFHFFGEDEESQWVEKEMGADGLTGEARVVGEVSLNGAVFPVVCKHIKVSPAELCE